MSLVQVFFNIFKLYTGIQVLCYLVAIIVVEVVVVIIIIIIIVVVVLIAYICFTLSTLRGLLAERLDSSLNVRDFFLCFVGKVTVFCCYRLCWLGPMMTASTCIQ